MAKLDSPDHMTGYVSGLLEQAELPRAPQGWLEPEMARVGDRRFWPLHGPQQTLQSHSVHWAHHDWRVDLWVGPGQPDGVAQPVVCVRLPWGSRSPADGLISVVPAAMALGPSHRKLATALWYLESPRPPALAEPLQQVVEDGLCRLQLEVREAFSDATVHGASGSVDRVSADTTLASWLDVVGVAALRVTYPVFARFAPTGPGLVSLTWRVFWTMMRDSSIEAAPRHEVMDAVRDGYLVPMRLLEQIDGQYRVPDLAGHELVEALFEMIVDAPTPSSVYARFKKAPYGLRQSHVEALLALMHALGRVDICGPVSWRDGWSSLPHPMQYMRIVATPGRTEPKA